MTILAFAPLYNTKGRKDATGAFQPEARAFVTLHGGTIVLVDNQKTPAEMRARIIEAITNAPIVVNESVVIAFFCHGSRNDIQFGFRKSNVAPLAKAIARKSIYVIVPLYACLAAGPATDAAGGDGGFADVLRDELCSHGAIWCRVDAHATAGHTTWNPYVRRFDGVGNAFGGCGGQYIVSPGSKLWPKWRKALRETDLRFTFSRLSIAEIHKRLAG